MRAKLKGTARRLLQQPLAFLCVCIILEKCFWNYAQRYESRLPDEGAVS